MHLRGAFSRRLWLFLGDLFSKSAQGPTQMGPICSGSTLHRLCRATLVALHCVAFFASCRRAEKGGGWDLSLWGALIFRPEVPKPCKTRFLGPLWTENRGAPKTPTPTTTDPTTHSRPSDYALALSQENRATPLEVS